MENRWKVEADYIGPSTINTAVITDCLNTLYEYAYVIEVSEYRGREFDDKLPTYSVTTSHEDCMANTYTRTVDTVEFRLVSKGPIGKDWEGFVFFKHKDQYDEYLKVFDDTVVCAKPLDVKLISNDKNVIKKMKEVLKKWAEV